MIVTVWTRTYGIDNTEVVWAGYSTTRYQGPSWHQGPQPSGRFEMSVINPRKMWHRERG